MNDQVQTRLLGTWTVLIVLTLGYVAVEQALDGTTAPARAVVTVSAIVISLVKVRIIMREFMDVRHAPDWLTSATDSVLAVAGTVMVASYFAGRAFG